MEDIDFEGKGTQAQNTATDNKPDNNQNAGSQQEDVTNLNGGGTDDITGKDNTKTTETNANEEGNVDNNPSTGELNIGDSVEVDGVAYTVSENGDLVDSKGNIFKKKSEISEWLKSVEVEDNNEDNNSINITSIQDALGVTITDEQGQPVEFTNDAKGVKSYVDSVINLRSNELQEAAINRLYQDNPLLKQFQDYVQLNGTPRGFGEIPDRSGIRVEKDNENQQVAIIRMAAKEFGNKSLNDNYIKYLRDSGGLYDEARQQLQALQEKDAAYRKDIEARAAAQRKEEEDNITAYWNKVHNVIDNRVISGYKLPESFTKERDGKKVVYTPADFFDYVSNANVEQNGNLVTGYQRDLANLTDDEYLNREMLDAWLMFTGGTYKDLIDLAVKEDKVRQLRLKSKEVRSNTSVKVVRANKGKSSIDDIIF